MKETGCFRLLILIALIFSAGIAHSQSTPITIATNDATSITSTSAVLTGSINPGASYAAAWFEWGTTTALGTRSDVQTINEGIGLGTFTQTLRSLQPHTTYYFRAVGYRPVAGTPNVLGDVKTFTTTGDAVPVTALSVSTADATSISPSGAILNGSVIPGGAVSAWFEWGTTTSLGTRSDVQTITGTATAVGFKQTLSSLQPHTTYYFKAVAYRSAGGAAAVGELRSFTTGDAAPAPALTVTTMDATSVTSNTSTLNGAAGLGGTPGAAWFEWGTTSALGSRTETRTFFDATNATLTFTLRTLQPGTTYYFRAVAYRSGGETAQGDLRSFTTNTETPAVLSITSADALGVISNSAYLKATVGLVGTGITGWFEWGPTTALSNKSEAQALAAGKDVSFVLALKPLTPQTTYYFRAVASSPAGTVRSEVKTFTTTAEATTALSVSTLEASAVSSTTAEIRGLVTPGSTGGAVFFEWGPSSAQSNQTPSQTVTAGSTSRNFAYSLTGLQPNTTYYFRAVGQASNTTAVRGEIRSFTTTRVASTTPQAIPEVEQGTIKSGYVIITPDGNSGAPTPTLTFGLVSGGAVQSQAGINPAPMTTDASMFVEVIPTLGRDIGVAFANPGESVNAVTLTLRDEDGITVGSPAVVSVAPHAQVSKFIVELFGATTIGTGFRGSVHMVSATPFAAVGFRFSGSVFSTIAVAVTAPVPGVPSITLTSGATPNSPLAGTVGSSTALIIPQFALAGGWSTQIALVNNTNATIVGRIDIFDTAGNPMPVKLNGETRSTFTYSIPVGGTLILAPRDANGQSPM